MYSIMALVLALLVVLDAFTAVQATLFVIQPSSGSTCSGGQSCTVQWLDNGESPLNTEIGVTTCGLYTGNMQLVQSIPAVNVANSQSLTFTPIAAAGPDSSDYYIAFTSLNLTVNGTNFVAYSSFFSLNNMSGSFSSPLESATSSIPIPSSLTVSGATGGTILSTVTLGSPSISLSSVSQATAAATSGFTTSTLASSSAIATSLSSSSLADASPSSSTASGSPSSNGATPVQTISLPFLGVLSLIFVSGMVF